MARGMSITRIMGVLIVDVRNRRGWKLSKFIGVLLAGYCLILTA